MAGKKEIDSLSNSLRWVLWTLRLQGSPCAWTESPVYTKQDMGAKIFWDVFQSVNAYVKLFRTFDVNRPPKTQSTMRVKNRFHFLPSRLIHTAQSTSLSFITLETESKINTTMHHSLTTRDTRNKSDVHFFSVVQSSCKREGLSIMRTEVFVGPVTTWKVMDKYQHEHLKVVGLVR